MSISSTVSEDLWTHSICSPLNSQHLTPATYSRPSKVSIWINQCLHPIIVISVSIYLLYLIDNIILFEFRNHVKYFLKFYSFSATQNKYYFHQVWDHTHLFKSIRFLVLLGLIPYFFPLTILCFRDKYFSSFLSLNPKGKETVLQLDTFAFWSSQRTFTWTVSWQRSELGSELVHIPYYLQLTRNCLQRSFSADL